jgi:hypothetical protein
MVFTKALALWLFAIGTAWALAMAWVHLVMTGFTESILPLPLTFLSLFSGPAVLIIGSTLVMAMWHSRLGSILILAACAWLTVLLGPDCLKGFHQEHCKPRHHMGCSSQYLS